MDDDKAKTGFIERLFHRILSNAPESAKDVSDLVNLARDNDAIDADTADLLEKTLAFADLEVRDVMVSRSQMMVVKIGDSPQKIVDYIIETSHSRLPVIDKDRDDILGVLHAKDLLRYFKQPDKLSIRALIREAVFVPESKSLNALLKEFRDKRVHLAMVVDEYGGISGLVTMEDVLEAIIGDIDDEFDVGEEDNLNIIDIGNGRWRINAMTEIEEFNHQFNTDFSDEDVDTVGGMVFAAFGRLPLKGEKIILGNWEFTVARVDRRRLHILLASLVDKQPENQTTP